MPLSNVGSDIQLTRNTATGKHDLTWGTDGNPVFDDSQEHAVMSLTVEHKGEYWADPTGNRGSLAWTLKEDRKSTPSKMQGYIEDALQPLADAGKIVNPKAPAVRKQAGRVEASISYTLPAGQSVTVKPGIGY